MTEKTFFLFEIHQEYRRGAFHLCILRDKIQMRRVIHRKRRYLHTAQQTAELFSHNEDKI